MADNIVAKAQKLVFVKAADVDKSPIGVGDLPFEIGLGDNRTRRVEKDLMLGNRQIDFHACLLDAVLRQGAAAAQSIIL